MVQSTFAARLRDAMEAKGLKQVDLLRIAAADGFKLGKSQVSQYVSGKTQPRAETLAYLARALDVDESWLAGTGDKGQVLPQPQQTDVKTTERVPCARSQSQRSSITYHTT